MNEGKVWRSGDNINIDIIFPGKYTYSVLDPEEMAKHALEDLDPEFAGKVSPGDVIVAGRNFGCGSSREQAATCLKYAGIRVVVARSFARIFFRNAVSQGLPVVQSEEAVDSLETGDRIAVDLKLGTIETSKGLFRFTPLPEFVLGILNEGGLIPYTKKRVHSSSC